MILYTIKVIFNHRGIGEKMRINHGLLALATILIIGQQLVGSAYAIKNGAPDQEKHPYVCWIATWDGTSEFIYLGTGSLIAPTIVLTAGHITQPPGGIEHAWVTNEPEALWIVENNEILEPDEILALGWHEVETWEAHPDYRSVGEKGITDWITHDVGILTLDVPIDLDEYAILPTPDLVDTLPKKQGVDLVGYGVQIQVRGQGIPPPGNWGFINFGYRYGAIAQLVGGNDVISDEFMRLTSNPAKGKGGTGFGDSGGPILLAGTDTILGVCSWGTNSNLAGISYEQRIDSTEVLEWIKSFIE